MLSSEELRKIEERKQAAIKRRLELLKQRGQTVDDQRKYYNAVINNQPVTQPSVNFNKPSNNVNQIKATTTNNFYNNTNTKNVTSQKPTYTNIIKKTNASSSNYLNKIRKSTDKNSFITPTKRPSTQNQSQDKRLKNDLVKSPLEQIMINSYPTIVIEFKLINNKSFYLNFQYSQRLIDKIKTLKNAKYDANNKRWCFNLSDYKEILEGLKNLNIDKVKLKLGEGFPDDLLNLLEDSLKYESMKVNLEEKLPSSILNKLFGYQKEAISFGVKREGRILLADDMGLGKTIESISLALYYFDDWPLLIVTPKSVKFQWIEAILKWAPNLEKDDVINVDDKKINSKKAFLVIISTYESIMKVQKFLNEPKCVILDECHMIKNSSSQRSKLVAKLVNKSKRLILVSGTPALSRPIELFNQLKLLLPKKFSNKQKFGSRYCDLKLNPWGQDFRGCTRADELKVVLESTVMIRRLKNDVLNELPPKIRNKVVLDGDISEQDKSELDKFINKFRNSKQVKEDENFIKAYTKSAEVKIPAVIEYLDSIVEKGTKCIVFAHHKIMLDAITEFFTSKKHSFIKIDGSTPISVREQSCDIFQKNPDCKVAILSITAAGVGLNLTAAQLVIFAELYYNPSQLTQAEDRAHRIGQKDFVLVEYLILPGTVDDHIWQMVLRKVDTLEQVGLKNDGFLFSSKEQSN